MIPWPQPSQQPESQLPQLEHDEQPQELPHEQLLPQPQLPQWVHWLQPPLEHSPHPEPPHWPQLPHVSQPP
ncbi:MAG TPA: hypothetical protein VMJ32_06110 [Pirellulales bacterium]|nr:hypothetical protein [Pirellulales bacterium]